MDNLIYVVPALGLLGLIVMAIKSAWVSKQDAGNDRMKEIAGYVAEGAMAFLKAEYRILAIYVVVAGIGLGILSQQVETSHWLIVVAFVIGAFFSALAGFFGMRIATKANVRTTQDGSYFTFSSAQSILHRWYRDGIGCGWPCGSRFEHAFYHLLPILHGRFYGKGYRRDDSSARSACWFLARC